MATLTVLSRTTRNIPKIRSKFFTPITAEQQQHQQHVRSPPSFRLFSTSPSSSTTTMKSSDSKNYNLATLAVFGTMCVTTFGLGCWQTQRYFEKVDLMEKREEELKLNPMSLDSTEMSKLLEKEKGEENSNATKFQRWILKGKYDYSGEILVGPRGPPIGALAASGPNSGKSSGGMSSGPQGYYVVTPFHLQPDAFSTDTDNNVVLINRGWVPISHIQNSVMWSCPKDLQTVVAVQSKMEQPKGFIAPPPQAVSKTKTTLPHPIFLYYHRPSIEEATNTQSSSKNHHPLFLTATASSSSLPASTTEMPTFPVAPKEDTVGEYKITPFVHGGYAVTWFGLSGAGIYMTRKLLLRR